MHPFFAWPARICPAGLAAVGLGIRWGWVGGEDPIPGSNNSFCFSALRVQTLLAAVLGAVFAAVLGAVLGAVLADDDRDVALQFFQDPIPHLKSPSLHLFSQSRPPSHLNPKKPSHPNCYIPDPKHRPKGRTGEVPMWILIA